MSLSSTPYSTYLPLKTRSIINYIFNRETNTLPTKLVLAGILAIIFILSQIFSRIQQSKPLEFSPKHSKATLIQDVLSSEQAKNLFALSKELYENIKSSLDQSMSDYYFGSPFLASSLLLQGNSTPETVTVEKYSKRATDLFVAAKKTGVIFENFLLYIRILDTQVRNHIPGYTGKLTWSIKLYPKDLGDQQLHGQTWHQDAEEHPMDMFLYYHRDCCQTPTFAVRSVMSQEPKNWDEINPPNNSFIRFQNQSHFHRGMTSQEDGTKLLITFWKLDQPTIA